jgi:NTE family protein
MHQITDAARHHDTAPAVRAPRQTYATVHRLPTRSERPERCGPTRRPGRARGRRPTTAFVLTGGAALGAAQAGMLRALYERGISPDMLVGASVGALNAAFVASRPQAPATADELARIWASIERHDVFPLDVTRVIGGLFGRRDHVVGAHALRRIVRRHLGFDDLAQAPIPLHVAAYDPASGREVLLSSGPAVDSLMAATAIPGVLPPVSVGGRRLVDASVVSGAPISHAVSLGAERIYVLPTRDRPRATCGLPRTAIDAALVALGARTAEALRADVARHAKDAEVILLPAPSDHALQPTDFAHARQLTFEALSDARAALARVRAGARRPVHLYAVPPSG